MKHNKFWILSLVLLNLINVRAFAYTENELIDIYSYAYNASGLLTKADLKLISKFENLQAEWNSILKPVVLGLRDPNLDSDLWVENTRKSLRELESIRGRMVIIAAQIENNPVKSTLIKISDLNEDILNAWVDVVSALESRNQEALRRASDLARAGAQNKAILAGPIVRRLREKIGDDAVNGAIERALRGL
jgi:hypothetical protein